MSSRSGKAFQISYMCVSLLARNVLKISGVVPMQSHFNDFKYHICVSLLARNVLKISGVVAIEKHFNQFKYHMFLR
jgi:hypothetical protein